MIYANPQIFDWYFIQLHRRSVLTEQTAPKRSVGVHYAPDVSLFSNYQDIFLLSILDQYKNMGLNVKGVDSSARFLDALAGISDPEEKRKTIG